MLRLKILVVGVVFAAALYLSVQGYFQDEALPESLDSDERIVGQTQERDDNGGHDISPAIDSATKTRIPMGLAYDDDWCYLGQLDANGRAIFRMEMDKWRKDKGYFSNFDRLNYASYEEDALRVLGNEGDLLALDTLYNRLNASRESVDRANELLYKSVAFGSTKAAITLATVHRVKMKPVTDGQKVTFAEDDIYKILAFYEIAAIGGDVMGLLQGTNFLSGLDLEVDDNQATEITEKAKDMLDTIRQEHDAPARADNAIRYGKAAERFRMYQFGRFFPDSDYDGWGHRYVKPDNCLRMNHESSVEYKETHIGRLVSG